MKYPQTDETAGTQTAIYMLHTDKLVQYNTTSEFVGGMISKNNFSEFRGIL